VFRICLKCGDDNLDKKFVKNKNICWDCQKAYNRRYYHENATTAIARVAKYKRLNKKRVNLNQRERRYRKNDDDKKGNYLKKNMKSPKKDNIFFNSLALINTGE
jgi:hypothetical protein